LSLRNYFDVFTRTRWRRIPLVHYYEFTEFMRRRFGLHWRDEQRPRTALHVVSINSWHARSSHATLSAGWSLDYRSRRSIFSFLVGKKFSRRNLFFVMSSSSMRLCLLVWFFKLFTFCRKGIASFYIVKKKLKMF